MSQMLLRGPMVVIIANAIEQVGALDAELARLSGRRDELQAAVQQGIRELVEQKGHELPDKWEAQPSQDGLLVSWSEIRKAEAESIPDM